MLRSTRSGGSRCNGRVALTGEPTRCENRAAHLDDRWFDVFALRVGAPEERHVAVVFNDISARKRAERALQEANRRKDEFLATLAHELRNPLAPLRTGLELARARAPAGDDLRRTIDSMDRQLSHLVRLVDDLLDVARISTGKLQLQTRPLTLGAVLGGQPRVHGDNVDGATLLAELFTLSGHEGWTAHDGVEAIEKAAQLEPDVILLDLGMPRADGYEAARRIRGAPARRRALLVALTGWGQAEDRRRGREAGFDRHLVKPAAQHALIQLLAASGARDPAPTPSGGGGSCWPAATGAPPALGLGAMESVLPPRARGIRPLTVAASAGCA